MTPSSEPKIHSCDAWRDPGPAVPIGTALRLVGLDEHAIARNYVHVLDQLTKPAAEAGSAEKLAVEILKECSRQIEAAQEVERSPNAGAPVIVQLVHTVSRPARVTREIENRIPNDGNLEAGSVTSETASAAEGVR